jgi:hypothetical protein
VCVVDWDDTLCATTAAARTLWVGKNSAQNEGTGYLGRNNMAEGVCAQWAKLSEQVQVLLHLLLAASGELVYILTNSQTGWVELTVRRFLPELAPLLPRLRIVSARSTYGTQDEEDMIAGPTQEEGTKGEILIQWKLRAMRDILDHASSVSTATGREDHHENTHTGGIEIVALGDSEVEEQAADRLAAELGPARITGVKWVKFAEKPSISELADQLGRVCLNLPKMLALPGTVKAVMRLTPDSPPPPLVPVDAATSSSSQSRAEPFAGRASLPVMANRGGSTGRLEGSQSMPRFFSPASIVRARRFAGVAGGGLTANFGARFGDVLGATAAALAAANACDAARAAHPPLLSPCRPSAAAERPPSDLWRPALVDPFLD